MDIERNHHEATNTTTPDRPGLARVVPTEPEAMEALQRAAALAEAAGYALMEAAHTLDCDRGEERAQVRQALERCQTVRRTAIDVRVALGRELSPEVLCDLCDTVTRDCEKVEVYGLVSDVCEECRERHSY